MAKGKSNIRWRESDEIALRKRVNAFNAKIRRVAKRTPELADIQPAPVKFSELKDQIRYRQDLNRIMKSMERYGKRGSEAEVKAGRGARDTAWAVGEFNIKQAVANRGRKKRRKALKERPQLSRGKPTGSLTKTRMDSIPEATYRPSRKRFDKMTAKDWEHAQQLIDQELNDVTSTFKKSAMRLNYIKGLREIGYSEDIVALVNQVDLDEFVATVQTDMEAAFGFMYDYKLHGYDAVEEAMRDTWEAAVIRSKAKQSKAKRK